MLGCAVVLLGKQRQKKKQKTNVCVFWALSLQTSDVSNGINKTGIYPGLPQFQEIRQQRGSGTDGQIGGHAGRQEEVVSE